MKIAVRISIVLVLLYWGLPAGFGLYLTKTAPDITRQVPVDLGDLSISQATGTKISYLTQQFEVPWTDIDDSQTKVETTRDHQMAWFCLRSGLKIFVWVTPQGKSAFDYAFLKQTYDITPDKVHYWSLSPQERYKELIQLRLKASFLQDMGSGHATNPAETGVFNLLSQNYKGFQFGNPKARPSMLDVRMFDDAGKIEIKFLQNSYDEPGGVTQPEINRIVQSLHRNEPQTLASSTRQ